MAQYVRNLWPSSTTKQVPFNTLIGYTPLTHQPTRSMDIPDLRQRLEKIKESRTATLEALRKSAERQEGNAAPRFKEYQPRDKVWLEGTNLKRIEGTPKLSPRWYGPFEVATKISHVAYRINLPKAWKIHNVFHASLLTPYRETDEHGPNFLEPPPDIIDNTPEWEVKTILKQRLFSRWKKKQFLVRWKGYSPVHDSWVNEDDMNMDELVWKFSGSQPSIRATSLLSKIHPLPIIAPSTLNNLNIPTFVPRINMSAPTTPTNALIEISPASSPSPTMPTLGPPLSWVGSNPNALRNLFLNMVTCFSLAVSDLKELSALTLTVCSYFSHYRTLPQSLEDSTLFHHINALNIYHFIQTNGQASNCTLTNYDTWAGTIRRLHDVLTPYMLNAFSPLPSPSILPHSLPEPTPLPMPPPSGSHSLLNHVATVEDALESDDNEEDPHSILQRDWTEYDVTNPNHYPVSYLNQWGCS